MKNLFISAIAVALSGIVGAQQAVLYTPTKSVKDQGISLQAWGSGTISETKSAVYQGTESLMFYTNNFFQGGTLVFGTPVDLAGIYGNSSDLLQFTLMIPTNSTVYSGGKAGGGMKGGGPSAGGFASGGGGAPGMPGGGPMGGKGGQAGGPAGGGKFGGSPGTPGQGGKNGDSKSPTDQITIPVKPIKMVRIVVTTSDGKKSEVYIPTEVVTSGSGWSQIALPVSAITGFDRTNKIVTAISLSGDQPAAFYLGDLRVVNDPTPVTGQINSSATNLALGDELTLSANGYAGASILTYEWDFDYKGQFVKEADGQAVNHTFRKPGTFNVVCRIVDKYGKKAPYQTSTTITVNG